MRTLQRFARSLYSNTAGNTLAMAAAAFFPLLAMIGGAIDLSVAYLAKSQMQNACDSAVLAGRQSMTGTQFTGKDRVEANKFFNFNFPDGRLGAKGLQFTIAQNSANLAELVGHASAEVPTSLMRVFGYETIAVAVNCNAKREPLNNDIMLVLDVTGSMRSPPSGSRVSKITALRWGAKGIYRGIGNSPNTRTRFGIVPYAMTVNVARLLDTDDILRNQAYVDDQCESGTGPDCQYASRIVNIVDSSWRDGTWDEAANITRYRESGEGCIEERPSIGLAGQALPYSDAITLEDVNERSTGPADTALQFGRYDAKAHAFSARNSYNGEFFYTINNVDVVVVCPAEATPLRQYGSESEFGAAIDATTARVGGNTYHDIGMLWGLRLLSRDGFFSSQNPSSIGTALVQQHIVFMTDGLMEPAFTSYSAYGINYFQGRVVSTAADRDQLKAFHTARFKSACNLAKSMGITVWVIALDVQSDADIAPCATSANHFYVSNGADLEQIFEEIGRNISRLRLSK